MNRTEKQDALAIALGEVILGAGRLDAADAKGAIAVLAEMIAFLIGRIVFEDNLAGQLAMADGVNATIKRMLADDAGMPSLQ